MSYNGHKNYNAWNVSLWIGNDEGLYRFAKECIRTTATREQAVDRMMSELPDETPDGVRYTRSNVRKALVGL